MASKEPANIPSYRILQALHYWALAPKATASCVSITSSRANEEHHEMMQGLIAKASRKRSNSSTETSQAQRRRHSSPSASSASSTSSNRAPSIPPLPASAPPIDKLAHSLFNFTKLQEKALNAQSLIEQRKLEGRTPIHFTVEKRMKRIATSDGVDPATTISCLAKEMMTIKKRSTSLELMHISLNDQGIRFVATPTLLEACCSGILHSKKEGHPPPFSPFHVAASFRGTRLEDWDM